MVCNLSDTSIPCPGFQSLELLENGSKETVTVLSYQRYKSKLYQLASPILGSIYFHKAATIQDVVNKVKEINQALLAWDQSLPAELRMRSFKRERATSGKSILRIFSLQALALQVFYDNVQLLLHTPLLAYSGSFSRSRLENCSNKHAQITRADINIEVFGISKDQCWQSAMRTSTVGQSDVVLAARNMPLADYINIQAFTAAVMLSIFALSSPLTACAADSKRAIGRLIKLPKTLGYNSTLVKQYGAITNELLRLILAEEMKSLTSDKPDDEVDDNSRKGTISSSANATQPTSSVPAFTSTGSAWPNQESHVPESEELQIPDSARTIGDAESIPEEEILDLLTTYGASSEYEGANIDAEDFHRAMMNIQNRM